jgi:hypothetical protein
MGLPPPTAMLRAPGLGGFGETLKLDVRSLDHPLQVEHKLGVHGMVGSAEGVQRCRARGMEDPEHAQLLKAAFVDSPVFLLCGGQNLRSGASIQADRDVRGWAFLFHHSVIFCAIYD